MALPSTMHTLLRLYAKMFYKKNPKPTFTLYRNYEKDLHKAGIGRKEKRWGFKQP